MPSSALLSELLSVDLELFFAVTNSIVRDIADDTVQGAQPTLPAARFPPECDGERT